MFCQKNITQIRMFFVVTGMRVITLLILRLLSSKAQVNKKNENHQNPVMLVLIGKLSLSTI